MAAIRALSGRAGARLPVARIAFGERYRWPDDLP